MKAIATDFDGTLATEGRVLESTLKALERWKRAGKTLILVTGREVPELKQVFPRYALFDRVIAENGAVLLRPSDDSTLRLGREAPVRLVEALRAANVSPLSVGQSVIAFLEKDLPIAREAIRRLGEDVRVFLNKGSVMVLPCGLDKGSGLKRAATELGLFPREIAGIGDAENDLDLLDACGLGVAVGNALPALQERATWVMHHDAGRGVEELVDQLLARASA
jgi:hydroxymethylpyrimidine pyrophosphatase-like HAD family hydrolase